MKLPTTSSFAVTRRRLVFALAFALGAAGGSASAASGKAPNFLFLFTDDQSHETVRALGNSEILTPNIDRLANAGVAYTNAYNMGAWNGAVCIASRTCLMSGRSIWRANEVERDLNAMAGDNVFWPQLLKSAGYQTYMTGKWHVKVDPKKLFDTVRHPRPGMPEDFEEGYDRPKPDGSDPWSPTDPKWGGHWEGGAHWSQVVADDTVDFLAEAAGGEKPFFMYVAFSAPHDPRQAPEEYQAMYPKGSVSTPASFLPEYPYKQEMGCYEEKPGKILRDERLAPFPRTEAAIEVHRREYYASITYLDFQVGRILDALEKSGELDNTYIFFTSDHGLACGHHGLVGKQSMYEHSMKPPLIVVGPGIPKNERRSAQVYLQDAMATTLELSGVAKPGYVEFNSLMPTLRDARAAGPYSEIYGCYQADDQRMIRVGYQKLIVYPKAGVTRLYDLSDDPLELRDLTGSGPEAAALTKTLFSRLERLMAEKKDALDLAKFFPNLATAVRSRD